MIFLLLQITHSSPDFAGGKTIGVAHPLTDYVCFLPGEFSLPTFYSEEERGLLQGTTLADAVGQKLHSLDAEFDQLRKATQEIAWCADRWWDEECGRLTVYDWKEVDAMYRSRALELPGTGHAMVPCVDMANHASGDQTAARYETDADGRAVLQTLHGRPLRGGEEVTITYGDEKGASEMIFSYGFLEPVPSARQLFLGLDIPMDDPLRMAKRFVCHEAPGVRVYVQADGQMGWESPFVWWICVNEEDGLNFRVLQTRDGARGLAVTWAEEEISPGKLGDKLAASPQWELFHLRATVTVLGRINRQLAELEDTTEAFAAGERQRGVRRAIWEQMGRLRELEYGFLVQAQKQLETQVGAAHGEATVS